MKALSIRAPWWWWILRGEKPLENRDWSTGFRGWFLIHASKSWNRAEIAEDAAAGYAMGGSVLSGVDWQRVRGCCGCLVGMAKIVDCIEYSSSPWFAGRYGHVVASPVRFAVPIPYRGALGYFDVPAVLAQSIPEVRLAR